MSTAEMAALDAEENQELAEKDDFSAETPLEEPLSFLPDAPQLPDKGLSYEDIQLMLAEKHKVMMKGEEPVMMIVSIMNVFLLELEELHKQHNDAVAKIMVGQTQNYVEEFRKTTASFNETVANTSVEAIRNIFDSHSAALNASRINNRWCAAIVAASALANIIVLTLT